MNHCVCPFPFNYLNHLTKIADLLSIIFDVIGHVLLKLLNNLFFCKPMQLNPTLGCIKRHRTLWFSFWLVHQWSKVHLPWGKRWSTVEAVIVIQWRDKWLITERRNLREHTIWILIPTWRQSIRYFIFLSITLARTVINVFYNDVIFFATCESSILTRSLMKNWNVNSAMPILNAETISHITNVYVNIERLESE